MPCGRWPVVERHDSMNVTATSTSCLLQIRSIWSTSNLYRTRRCPERILVRLAFPAEERSWLRAGRPKEVRTFHTRRFLSSSPHVPGECRSARDPAVTYVNILPRPRAVSTKRRSRDEIPASSSSTTCMLEKPRRRTKVSGMNTKASSVRRANVRASFDAAAAV